MLSKHREKHRKKTEWLNHSVRESLKVTLSCEESRAATDTYSKQVPEMQRRATSLDVIEHHEVVVTCRVSRALAGSWRWVSACRPSCLVRLRATRHRSQARDCCASCAGCSSNTIPSACPSFRTRWERAPATRKWHHEVVSNSHDDYLLGQREEKTELNTKSKLCSHKKYYSIP